MEGILLAVLGWVISLVIAVHMGRSRANETQKEQEAEARKADAKIAGRPFTDKPFGRMRNK